jgi:hypothetical protein
MNISFDLPDQLLPALLAEYLIVSTGDGTDAESPEEYFVASIINTVDQRARIYEVGPHFTGAKEPRFLQNGMPNPDYTGPDAIVLPPEVEG